MSWAETHNGGAVPLPAATDVAGLHALLREGAAHGGRVVAYFAQGEEALWAVLGDDGAGRLRVARATVDGGTLPSLAAELPEVHLFEREIREQAGLELEGHPWPNPVRFTRPGDVPGVQDFYRVEGEGVHEVAVGPVHAGIIEPGHFRFQCHGEEVFHLEIALGYQHRGVEAALVGSSPESGAQGGAGPQGRAVGRRALHLAETLAGDTTVGHATAWCQALEALSGARVPPRAQAIRAVALELERLANHVGDLGALANDVAYLPTASFCGRIRGEYLNMTAALCGSRFGRGLVVPGGVAFDVEPALAEDLLRRLDAAARDTAGAVGLLWDEPSVMGRFEATGTVQPEVARSIGLVGPAARASGLSRDVRCDHPAGMYRMAQVPPSVVGTGDVLARAQVRWLEHERSVAFVRELLSGLPEGALRVPLGPLAAGAVTASLVEGWRGEIAHVLVTDDGGRVAAAKVVDPSFHNWAGLALALRSQPISDFPLCNKSFNLSYCGHDL